MNQPQPNPPLPDSALGRGPGLTPQWGSQIGTAEPAQSHPWQSVVPAHKPGLIPLRPLGISDVIGATFGAIARTPRLYFGLSLLFNLALTVIVAAITVLVTTLATDGTFDAAAWLGAVADDPSRQLVMILAAALCAGPFAYVAAAGCAGMPVARGEVRRALRPQLFSVLTVSFTTVGLVAGPVVVTIGTLDRMVTSSPVVMLARLAIVAVVGIPAFWLIVRLALAPAVAAVDGLSPIAALRRSFALTAGNFWRHVTALALIGVVIMVISTTLGLIPTLVSLLFADAHPVLSLAITTALGIVIGAIAVPALAMATGILYVDARIRHEGFELQLAQIAADRHRFGGGV